MRPGTAVRTGLMVLAVMLLMTASACWRPASQPPPPKDVPLIANPSFSRDIQPILNEFCVKCHSVNDAHGGLRLDTYADIMRGGNSGRIVLPETPENSLLLLAIQQKIVPMPYHGEQLTLNRITSIASWLKAGAPNN